MRRLLRMNRPLCPSRRFPPPEPEREVAAPLAVRGHELDLSALWEIGGLVVAAYAGWCDEHRPHQGLAGATPLELGTGPRVETSRAGATGAGG